MPRLCEAVARAVTDTMSAEMICRSQRERTELKEPDEHGHRAAGMHVSSVTNVFHVHSTRCPCWGAPSTLKTSLMGARDDLKTVQAEGTMPCSWMVGSSGHGMRSSPRLPHGPALAGRGFRGPRQTTVCGRRVSSR